MAAEVAAPSPPVVSRQGILVLIGEDNPRTPDPRYALYDKPDNCSGWYLRRYLGVTRRRYLGVFRRQTDGMPDIARVDLCVSKWSDGAAKVSARDLLKTAIPEDVFVLLGRKVASAFGFRGVAPFEVLPASNIRPAYVLLPHPSGRNMDWMESGAVARAREALLRAAPWATWLGEDDPVRPTTGALLKSLEGP